MTDHSLSYPAQKEAPPPLLSRVGAALAVFSEWCHHAGTLVALPLMAFLITINVFMRYFLNKPLAWGEELNGLLLFLVLFLSMTYTWDQKRHIRMELVYVRLRGRWRALSDWVTGISGIIFFGLLGAQCIADARYMIKTLETGEDVTVPLWWFRALAALISLVFVIKLVLYLIRGRHEEGEFVSEVEGVVIHKERS